jgi:CDP-diacylglycerol--glycerol-3-phosphate 3-phosphatidyltransferase
MLNGLTRAAMLWLLTPPARLLVRAGVSPDAVTIAGTLGVVAAALLLFPSGHLLAGTLVIAVLALADTLDGIMARLASRSGPWGAFLDSTLDRVADAALFGGLVVYYSGAGDDRPTALLALACLVLGALVPYARARAEGLGLRADVGVAERADRLVAVLLGTLLVGLGAPTSALTVVLAGLAVASAVTIGQRVAAVRRQLAAAGDAGVGRPVTRGGAVR